jgi:hypothetical protein
MCCQLLITLKFLALELPFHTCKSPEIAWGEMDCMVDVLMGFHQSTFSKPNRIQFRSCPMWFLGFSNHEKGAPRQEILKWSTVCSTFSRSGWSIVRSASPKEALRKRNHHHTSTKFWLKVISWLHELCQRPLYMHFLSPLYEPHLQPTEHP